LFYSQNTEEWRHFEYHRENPQSISDDDVQVLFEDSRGILWVGTANGLNKVDRSAEDEIFFERITKENGLPNNAIYGILEDPLRQIWLSTNLGLVRYSDFTESMQSFRSRDGLSSDEFNKSAFYSDTNGLLYFGSINGITVVDSKEVKQPSRQSNLKLSEVRVGQEDLDVYKLNQIEMPSIEKREGDPSVRISVAELFYRKLETQSYRYRILGLSDKWINLGKERSFILAGMDEGEYIINIQSRIGDEPWSKNTLTLTLNVYEDFWSSVDAVYLVVFTSLVLFGISAGVIRQYYRSQIQKKDNRLKIESVRLKDVRRQNEEIKNELSNKISKISELNEELTGANELIDSHTFREPISGFYRYNNLDFMLSDLAYEDDLLNNLNIVMVFQLIDYAKHKQKFGTICGAEVRAYVASELRKLLPSNVHLCFLFEDSFIIFGNSVEQKNLSSLLFNLKGLIERSHISIAYEVFVQTMVNCSYIELYPDKINTLSSLKKLADICIGLHLSRDEQDNSKIMRIDLNKEIIDFDSRLDEVKELIESNIVTLHYI
ncbi:MAG: triple tyrosine motif-containing protein, partial [Kangiellaceae bacterium]|nr:triple tyrosine motif-containing protein [Kangiellaceae bacterium]